jgi:sulfatase modifying factor 1
MNAARLLLMLAALLMAAMTQQAHAVTIDWVTVGNPGNDPDPATGNLYGAVADVFRIMKFEFTNSQYVQFLNAVDPNGTNPNSIYNVNMGTNARGGISVDTNASAGSKYNPKPDMGDKPVNYVSWWAAARVANWLHNGAQAYESTDSSASAPQNIGAYTVGTATSGDAVAKNAGALYWVPTENEWYKAAFYNPTLNSGDGGYRVYGNGFDDTPEIISANEFGVGSAGGVGNFANYLYGSRWNEVVGMVTTVGTNGAASYYGAHDMSGNVWEWNDLTGAASPSRGLSGGGWGNTASALSSSGNNAATPSSASPEWGIRLAAVPEPSTYCMALAGLACGGYTMFRRRKRA